MSVVGDGAGVGDGYGTLGCLVWRYPWPTAATAAAVCGREAPTCRLQHGQWPSAPPFEVRRRPGARGPPG